MKTKNEIRKAIQTLHTGRERIDDFNLFEQRMILDQTEGLGSITQEGAFCNEIMLSVSWKALKVVKKGENTDDLCENFANSLHEYWYGELSYLLRELKFHINHGDSVMSRKIVDEILKKIES